MSYHAYQAIAERAIAIYLDFQSPARTFAHSVWADICSAAVWLSVNTRSVLAYREPKYTMPFPTDDEAPEAPLLRLTTKLGVVVEVRPSGFLSQPAVLMTVQPPFTPNDAAVLMTSHNAIELGNALLAIGFAASAEAKLQALPERAD